MKFKLTATARADVYPAYSDIESVTITFEAPTWQAASHHSNATMRQLGLKHDQYHSEVSLAPRPPKIEVLQAVTR